MKIMHLVNSLDRGNGITNVVVDLAIAQVQRGHTVTVVGHSGYYTDFLIAAGVHFLEVDFRKRTPLTLIKAATQLRRIVRREAPSVIHAHTITPLLLARVVVKDTVPMIATVHNEWQKSSDLMKYASIVVGVSPPVAASMIRRGVPESKMRTVCNGTTGSTRRSKTVVTRELKQPAILFVGSLSRRKGTDVLLTAFAQVRIRVPNAHLYLVGNNDLPVTDHMLDELGIRDVTHLEGLGDPYEYYGAADVFVLPSRSEPAALVMLEALESGCPVIGSDTGGIRTYLKDEGGGVAVPVEDSDALATAIVQVLTDDNLRLSLHRNSLRVAGVHSVAVMSQGYDEIYKEALAAIPSTR